MNNLNLLFRERIGLSKNKTITFNNLPEVLNNAAMEIPFENLNVLEDQADEITKENLITKILTKNQGGLCYDLNAILYLFLLENGFNVSLIRGVTYDSSNQRWNTIGKTHVAIILNHKEQSYIIDTGFGTNLPLKPVPFNGEIVTSKNGAFRVEGVDTEHGDYIFFMKLYQKENEWKPGYVFDASEAMKNVSTLNEVQEVIRKHPDSPFNKRPLATRLTDRGNITLTGTSFTEWVDGKVKKENIDKRQFTEMLQKHFGIQR
ncbi:arylamine N-acetyltransferase family protein [Pseudalkalibacillus caeni]|uniref:Arylamine N-acetyltransferase n=1 Tax=Exobacillus caeni TaxID=2574798 RepID=A0A5R9F392_9BACL|nr:arylamine N-acetyltransferase [Pseudalkalibacillus caeni]TLS36959.1 arylamine N-acetyltransferase [Pseudalkalibacillus caeni]